MEYIRKSYLKHWTSFDTGFSRDDQTVKKKLCELQSYLWLGHPSFGHADQLF